jgi:hypothetical protein
MEKKRRESTAGWVFESNEGQSNQQAEVTSRLLGRSLGMCLLLAAAPEFGGGGASFRCSRNKANLFSQFIPKKGRRCGEPVRCRWVKLSQPCVLIMARALRACHYSNAQANKPTTKTTNKQRTQKQQLVVSRPGVRGVQTRSALVSSLAIRCILCGNIGCPELPYDDSCTKYCLSKMNDFRAIAAVEN